MVGAAPHCSSKLLNSLRRDHDDQKMLKYADMDLQPFEGLWGKLHLLQDEGSKSLEFQDIAVGSKRY